MKTLLSILVSVGICVSFLLMLATLEWEKPLPPGFGRIGTPKVDWLPVPSRDYRTAVILDEIEYRVRGKIIQLGLRSDGVVVWRDKP